MTLPKAKSTPQAFPKASTGSFPLAPEPNLHYNLSMLEWTLKPGDPANLTLATDARTGVVSYTDDHIWEVVIGRSEPPAVVIQTTFGTRARSFRIFPRFGEGDRFINDPAQFQSPIIIQRYFPNYARLSFSPLPELEVVSEYWVAASQSVCGRFHLRNLATSARQVTIELVGVLNPDSSGERILLQEMDAALVLAGKSGNLAPLIYLRGGSQPPMGPFACLASTFELPSNGTQTITWAEAALDDIQASFALARQMISRIWESEVARLELLNGGMVEVLTGDPAWDNAFARSQTQAFSLLTGPTPHLPAQSFVLTRLPDQGYSWRGDGQDYGHLWNGQSPLDALYLSGFLLPTAPELVRGLVRNFLATQSENGEVDHKPGLGGQRTQLMAAPLLASLIWRIYEVDEGIDFLQETYPKLIHFLKAWFSPAQDRDRDGIPEWEHLFQLNIDDHPLFSNIAGSQGLNPATIESPDLCAMLHRECLVLIRISRLLRKKEDLPFLVASLKRLKNAIESTWNEADACYHYRDRDTHEAPAFEVLGCRSGSGDLPLHKEFAAPVRLGLRLDTADVSTRRLFVFLHGSSPSGAHRIERLSTSNFTWSGVRGDATSERVYITIEHVEVQGLKENDILTISCAGLADRDLTHLLPLWGGIPDAKRQKKLVQQTLLDPTLFWKPCGVPTRVVPPPEATSLPSDLMQLPWNELIGEGLLAYGYREEAAELLIRLMRAIIGSFEQQGAFSHFYLAESGAGVGEHNALPGLAPLRLFLETLGVRIANPKRIFIQGFNPFPWPVTVKYRGTTILRYKEKTTIIFPDGQTVTTDKTSPAVVALE